MKSVHGLIVCHQIRISYQNIKKEYEARGRKYFRGLNENYFIGFGRTERGGGDNSVIRNIQTRRGSKHLLIAFQTGPAHQLLSEHETSKAHINGMHSCIKTDLT
jgi:hypothetical protein